MESLLSVAGPSFSNSLIHSASFFLPPCLTIPTTTCLLYLSHVCGYMHMGERICTCTHTRIPTHTTLPPRPLGSLETWRWILSRTSQPQALSLYLIPSPCLSPSSLWNFLNTGMFFHSRPLDIQVWAPEDLFCSSCNLPHLPGSLLLFLGGVCFPGPTPQGLLSRQSWQTSCR